MSRRTIFLDHISKDFDEKAFQEFNKAVDEIIAEESELNEEDFITAAENM